MFFCSHGTAENKYLKVPQIKDDSVDLFKMQLTLRYGGTCARVWLWSQSSATTNPAEKRSWISRLLTRGNRLESSSSSRTIKFLPTFVVFFPFLLCQKCICKASLYSEKHLLFSTLTEKKRTLIFNGEAYYTAFSVFLQRHCDLAFSVSSSCKTQYKSTEPAFLNQTLGVTEYLTTGLWKLYLLFITCWRSCQNSTYSDDTTALRPGGHPASSSTSPFRGKGNWNVFLYGRILWIWPHAVVVIYLLDLQKGKKKKQVVRCAQKHRQPNNKERYRERLSQYFECFCVRLRSFLLSKCFTMKNLTAWLGLVSRQVVNLSSDGALCFQH